MKVVWACLHHFFGGRKSDEDKPRPVRIKLDSTFIRRITIANSYKLKKHPRLHRYTLGGGQYMFFLLNHFTEVQKLVSGITKSKSFIIKLIPSHISVRNFM